MSRKLSFVLLLVLMSSLSVAQDTIDQKIKEYETQLANPNLPAALKPIIEVRIDRLKQIKTLDLQIAAAQSLKTSIADLSTDESRAIDEQIRALEQKKAKLTAPANENVSAPAQATTVPTTSRVDRALVRSTPTDSGATVRLSTQSLEDASQLPAVKTYAKAVARATLTSRDHVDGYQTTIMKLGVLTIAGSLDTARVGQLSGDTLDLLSKPLTDDLLVKLRVNTETARTDKQVGASGSADGTTSLLDKPGIPSLLGFALENGAIDKNVSGTTITLSTSPYSILAAFGGGDTQTNYNTYSFYRRFGVSATFNMQDQNNPDPTAVSRKQLDEWSARIRLTDDRSTRSKAFAKRWNDNFGNIRESLGAEGPVFNRLRNLLIDSDAQIQDALQKTLQNDTDWIDGFIDQNKGLPADQQEQKLTQEILKHLEADVVQRLSEKTVGTQPDQVSAILADWIQAQQQHLKGAKGFEDLAADFSKQFNATVAYTNKRQLTQSDYSVIKLVLDKHVAGQLIFTINAGASFYHRPDATLNQNTFRDVATAFSFEQAFGRSPFLSAVNDKNPITATLSGRYQRIPEYSGMAGKKPDIGAVSFKLELPVATAVTLPLSITYANAPGLQELKAEKFVRGNFGLTFDLDKLFTVLHPPQAQ